MEEIKHIELETSLGTVAGNCTGEYREFLGIPYARAERFRYAVPVDRFEGKLHAVSYGSACPQYRMYFPQLDNPERLFYYREFREGIDFHYDEDCLNLNICTPALPEHCPVMIFIHGGGFNSGCNQEEPFRGYEFAKNEYTDPKRMLTTTVKVTGGVLPRIPVISTQEVPKDRLEDCLKVLYGLELKAPVQYGEIICENILGTGVDIKASRTLQAK